MAMLSTVDIDAQPSTRRGAIGVYFFVHAGVLVYVGQSIDVERRIRNHGVRNRYFAQRQHPHGMRPFDEAFWIPVGESHLGAVERFLIVTLKPVLNAHRFLRPGDDPTRT